MSNINPPKYKSTIFEGQQFEEDFDFQENVSADSKEWPMMPTVEKKKSNISKDKQKQQMKKILLQLKQHSQSMKISPKSSKLQSEDQEQKNRITISIKETTERNLSNLFYNENTQHNPNTSKEQLINQTRQLPLFCRQFSSEEIQNRTGGTDIVVIPEESISLINQPSSPYDSRQGQYRRQNMYDENIQRIKEMGEKIGVLEERNSQLENQVKLLYNFKKEVQRLSKQVKQLKNQKINLVEQNKQFQRNIETCSSLIQKYEKQIEELKYHKLYFQQANKVLEQQIEQSHKLYQSFTQGCQSKIDDLIYELRDRFRKSTQDAEEKAIISKKRIEQQQNLLKQQMKKMRKCYEISLQQKQKIQNDLYHTIETLKKEKNQIVVTSQRDTTTFVQIIKMNMQSTFIIQELKNIELERKSNKVDFKNIYISNLEQTIKSMAGDFQKMLTMFFESLQNNYEEKKELKYTFQLILMKYLHEVMKNQKIINEKNDLEQQIEKLRPKYKQKDELFDKFEKLLHQNEYSYQKVLSIQKIDHQSETLMLKQNIDNLKIILELNQKVYQQEKAFNQGQITQIKYIEQQKRIKLNDRLSKALVQIQTLEDRVLSLQEEIASNEQLIQSLRAQNLQYDNDRCALDQIIYASSLAESKTFILKQLLKAIKKYDTNNFYSQLFRVLNDSYQEYYALNTKLNQLKIKIQNQQKQIFDLNKQKETLEIHNRRKDDQINYYNKKVQMLEKKLISQIEEKQSIQLLKEKLNKYASQINELNNILKKKDDKEQQTKLLAIRNQAQLEYKIEQLQQQIEQMKQSSQKVNKFQIQQQLPKEQKYKDQQLKKLKEKQKINEIKIQQFLVDKEGLQKQMKMLRKQKQEYQASKSRIFDQPEENKQIVELRKQLLEKQQQLDKAKDNILDLKLQINVLKASKPLKIEEKNPQQFSISPASSPNNSKIVISQIKQLQIKLFTDSFILRQKYKQEAYLIDTIQKYAEKAIKKVQQRAKMINKKIETYCVKQSDKETILFLFKGQKSIFAVISFPPSIKKDLSVIMASLTRQKTVFPAKQEIKSQALRNESFVLTFGANEAKVVWTTKRFIVYNESQMQKKYFESEVSLKNDIFGFEKVDFQELQIYFIKFSE